jgi:hypothetical protein
MNCELREQRCRTERNFRHYSTFRGKVRGLDDVLSPSVALIGSVFAELSVRPDLIHKLVPPHCEETLRLRAVDVHNFKPIPLEQLRITLD